MNTISPIDLKNAARQLPPSPRIFGKLGKMLRDTNTGIEDITELVNADSSLTAQVLRLSNSAMYSGGLSVDTLDEAINRIGFRELFKLVGVAASAQLFNGHNRIYDTSGSAMWENSLACGIAMETLARMVGYDEQEAYTVGLLRNMGKMAIDFCASKDPSYPAFSESSGLPLIDWEESNFGITNPGVASFILASWNFPPETCLAIQYQYEPAKAQRKLPMTHLLNLANGLAAGIGKGLRGENCYWRDSESHFARTGLSAAEFAQASEETTETLERAIAAIS